MKTESRMRRMDPKVYWSIAVFLGMGTMGGAISRLQWLAGWAAGPAIQAAQKEGLDSLRSWHHADQQTQSRIVSAVDSIAMHQKHMADLLQEMPEAKAAARRLRDRQRDRDDLFSGRRGLADDGAAFRAWKGEPIQ